MLNPGDPYLLPVDDVFITLFHSGCLDLGGVSASGRFGHRHRLQTQFSTRKLGQVVAFLLFAAVTQQGEHVVHLAVNSAGVAAAIVYFLQDHRCFSQAQAGTTIFLRDHCRQPPSFRHGADEALREAFLFVNLAPVGSVEFGAQRAYAFTDGFNVFAVAVGHRVFLEISMRGNGERNFLLGSVKMNYGALT
ncbi:hypothetical protein D3C71_524960 [compost metagenome]